MRLLFWKNELLLLKTELSLNPRRTQDSPEDVAGSKKSRPNGSKPTKVMTVNLDKRKEPDANDKEDEQSMVRNLDESMKAAKSNQTRKKNGLMAK